MVDNSEVATWLKHVLPTILPFPVTDNIISNIVAIESERDLLSHLRYLLNGADPPNFKEFSANFKAIRHVLNRKEDNFFQIKEVKKNEKPLKVLTTKLDNISVTDEKTSSGSSGKKKKKEKFVNVYSPEGSRCDAVILKGRHHCDCQAFKHRLVNNCLSCGRIVCDQEGSGPCLFCGSLVCSKEEQSLINSKAAGSQKLYDNLMAVGRPDGWEEAIAHRDRLLEFDRTTQRRTRVIDDEGEYFSVNSVWLSSSEKEKMTKREEAEREKKHASRLQTKFTLDFAGRQITEDTFNYDDNDEDWSEAFQDKNFSSAHPNINSDWKPEYVSSGNSLLPIKKSDSLAQNINPRVQDRELLEMSDPGACLSLHQPWASLLVHGIMRHEGRSWYSAHRGRLWIAAASKQPTDEEIKATEEYFKLIRNGENLLFPKQYPTSCLLGCVTLVDCLSNDEYRMRYPKTESESPFVYICEDAKALSLKFPISGRHKIYKLDRQIHSAAQKALLRSPQEMTTIDVILVWI